MSEKEKIEYIIISECTVFRHLYEIREQEAAKVAENLLDELSIATYTPPLRGIAVPHSWKIFRYGCNAMIPSTITTGANCPQAHAQMPVV